MNAFLILAFGLLFLYAIHLLSNKPKYKSKTGKPFVERDADGFLTPESYQSHIEHYNNGRVKVDLNALVQTREFHNTIAGPLSLRDFIKNQKKS